MTVLENIKISDKECAESRKIASPERIKLRKASRDAIVRRRVELVNAIRTNSDTNSRLTSIPLTVERIDDAKVNNDNIIQIDVSGQALNEAYKALRLKEQMRASVVANSKARVIVAPVTSASDNIIPTSSELESVLSAETAGEAKEEQFRVSTNEASAAKIAKYADDDRDKVSVIDMETTSAREVSREVPLVAPDRDSKFHEVQDTKTNDVVQPQREFDFIKEEMPSIAVQIEPVNMPSTDFNATSLDELREGLAETVKLQDEVAEAQSKEAQAKESAMRAEAEAAATHDKLLATVQMLTAHKKALKAQAAMSAKQASIYEAQYGDYTAEKDEYEKMINDMLAVMGESTVKENTESHTRKAA